MAVYNSTHTGAQIDTALDSGQNIDIDELMLKVYPVGSIYISTTSANPSTTIGGQWTAFGQGRMLMGIGSNGTTTYSTAEATGGHETVTLVEGNLPSHKHSVNAVTANGNTHSHSLSVGARDCFYSQAWSGASGSDTFMLWGSSHTYSVSGNGNHGHTVPAHDTNTTGSGTPFSILNPYIIVYMWKRTG